QPAPVALSEYTPEKVAELVAEARDHMAFVRRTDPERIHINLYDRLADALTAVSAERDAEHKRAEGLTSVNMDQRRVLADTRGESHAAAEAFGALMIERDELRAERDRLHKAITEALDWRDEAYHGAFGKDDYAQGYGYARPAFTASSVPHSTRKGNDNE